MSHLEREAPDWLNVSFLFVQASCLGEWWGAVNQWESSGEDATVIQEKTAHCSWDVREVWPASGRLRLLSPTAHWQVRLSCDTAEPWNWLVCSFWAKNIATFILWWLSLRKLPSQEFVVPLGVTSFSAPRQDFTAVVLAAVIVEVINSMYCSFQPVWHTGTADALHRQRGLCYQLMYWFCDESEGVHHEGECACLWERIYTLFS